MQTDPYLHFNGTCEAAFKLYEKVLGGNITFSMTHGDSPMADKVPPDWKGKIMHSTLTIGNRLIQGMDAPPSHYSKPQGFSMSISTKDPAEAEKLFNALSENGSVTMPLEKTFWAARFGMLTDQFGIPRMINCENPA